MKTTLELVVMYSKEFYDTTRNEQDGRYRSWEHCYSLFHDARDSKEVDIDYLALNLGFYLASWGMYRGSSFLLQNDYKIHKGVVEIILEEKYDSLFGIECEKLREDDSINLLMELCDRIEKYYRVIRDESKDETIMQKVSETLITKILLGTLGCVPAYDEYFVTAVRKSKTTIGVFNKKSLLGLIKFYINKDNNDTLEDTRKNMKIGQLDYPQMKLLDMGFWKIGKKIKETKDD